MFIAEWMDTVRQQRAYDTEAEAQAMADQLILAKQKWVVVWEMGD